MMKVILSSFLLLCCSQIFAATEAISLNFHLRHSKRIQTIRILRYDVNSMFYVNLKGDTLNINCDTRTIQLSLNEHEKDLLEFRESGKPVDWVHWPKAGERLIMVTNEQGNVDLFARRIGKHFAFWSPNSIPYAGYYFVGIDATSFIGKLDDKQVEFKQVTIFHGHNLVRIRSVQKDSKPQEHCEKPYFTYGIIGVFLFICFTALLNTRIKK